MQHKFYLYSETREISLKHHYPNKEISAKQLIQHLKPITPETMDINWDDPEDIEFHTAYKFCITITSITAKALLEFTFDLIRLTTEKISNGHWDNDDDYFDNAASYIQELYLILLQWPKQYSDIEDEAIGNTAYNLLLSFYKSLGLLYDSEEALTPNFKFSGFYNEI